MWDTLRTFLDEHSTLMWWLAAGSGVLLLLSMLALPAVAVLLPQDFLQRAASPRELPPGDWRRRHPAVRWSLRILKNLAGGVLALAGLAMLILPGQGLLTLAFALLLLDLPGKRRLEAKVLGSPRLLRMINGLRRRFGREPLQPAT